jgi:dTDP-glucose pyrophosphorylase
MRAVVLARGLGTRMRTPDPGAPLSDAQRRAADAGIADLALVVAPDHDEMRRHYATHPPARVTLAFVVQPEPLGTANAVAAVEPWASGAPFLAMNADNLYPVPALQALVALDEPGLPAFDAEDLVRTSNIPAERIYSFAIIETDTDGYLTGIIEKPNDIPAEADLPPKGGSHSALRVASGFSRKVSMNCWRFDARIFAACRDVPRSARGEFELPEAVGLASGRGVRFKAIPARGPVLDLSRRADTADVERRLAGRAPQP